MGIEFNRNTGISPFQTPITNVKLYNHISDKSNNINFGKNLSEDKFQNNSITKLCNENEIKKMISANPQIKELLAKNKIPIKLNMKELTELMDNHAKDTENIALNIVKYLPPALKQKVNIKELKEACILHDIGKVLIPPEVLNKNGSLTPEEFRIMQLHSELGYQLLKTTGISENVLDLVRYHHNNTQETKNSKIYVPDINLQILNLADKYSALTEKRVYKEKFTPKTALTILLQDAKKGDIHPSLFNALVKSLSENKTKSAV